METTIYLSGVSSGAFAVLAAFALVFFWKTRGFRLRLGVENDYPSHSGTSARDEPPVDYYEMSRRLAEEDAKDAKSVPGGAFEPVPPVSRTP